MEELFFTEQDVQQDKFYKLDKNLFGNDIYKGLSLGAKVVYGILKDRQSLSESNKSDWLDEKGRIYFYFDIEKLAELLETSKTTMIKYKKELEKYKLLYQFRQGQGKPNKMYCLKSRSIDNALKLKNCTSRSIESEILEVKKLYTNNTEINYTENIDTEIKDYRGDLQSSKRKTFDEIIKDFLKYDNSKIIKNVLNLFFREYAIKTGYNQHFELNTIKIKECLNSIKKLQALREKEYNFTEEQKFFEEIVEKYFEINTKDNYYSLQNFLHDKKLEYILIQTEYKGNEFYEELTNKQWF